MDKRGNILNLRPWQKKALDSLHDPPTSQVVQAVMGAGKSVVIAKLVEHHFRHGRAVTVTCPSQMLVTQLAETLREHTQARVGVFYADEKDPAPVTVVCHASLGAFEHARREWMAGIPDPERIWIADECHQTENPTVLDWLESVGNIGRVGFTATPFRATSSESVSAFDELAFGYGAQDAFRDGYVVKPTVEHAREGDADDVVIDWMIEHAKKGRKSIVANAIDIADCEAFAHELTRRGIPNIAVHSESSHSYDDARGWIADGRGVVCYVDMLAEGFNAPEIQAMALRRPVKSRVRFAQEVGRGLRAHEGKEECFVLDCYDLFNAHSVDWRACLGEVESDVVPALKLELAVESSGWRSSPDEIERLPHELLGPLRSFLRTTRVRLQFEGKISLRIESTHWRSDPVTSKQIRLAHQLMQQIDPSTLDDATRKAIETAYFAAIASKNQDPWDLKDQMRKGDVSDLISILRGI